VIRRLNDKMRQHRRRLLQHRRPARRLLRLRLRLLLLLLLLRLLLPLLLLLLLRERELHAGRQEVEHTRRGSGRWLAVVELVLAREVLLQPLLLRLELRCA